MYLRVGEWDRKLDRVRGVDVDWGGVWRCSSPHATDNFLTVVAVVYVGGYYFFVGAIAARDVKGIEVERGGVVREIWESRVVIVHDFFFPMVINGFFNQFDSGCGTGETFEHGYKARIGGFPDHVSGGYDDRGWHSDMDGG